MALIMHRKKSEKAKGIMMVNKEEGEKIDSRKYISIKSKESVNIVMASTSYGDVISK